MPTFMMVDQWDVRTFVKFVFWQASLPSPFSCTDEYELSLLIPLGGDPCAVENEARLEDMERLSRVATEKWALVRSAGNVRATLESGVVEMGTVL